MPEYWCYEIASNKHYDFVKSQQDKESNMGSNGVKKRFTSPVFNKDGSKIITCEGNKLVDICN